MKRTEGEARPPPSKPEGWQMEPITICGLVCVIFSFYEIFQGR
jgi:hypothetical protein